MKIRIHNIHGAISAILFLISFSIGVISVFLNSVFIGIFDLLFIAAAFIVVAVVYCSKCRCREHCNHIFIGWLSVLLSKKNETPYNAFDIVAGLTPLFAAIAFQQFWLIENQILLICFWVALLSGGLEAYLFVCNKCRNYACKMCRNKIIVLNHD